MTSTFFVTGAPPLGLTAALGTVNPAVLNAPGNATYSYTVPAGTPAGSTLNDTVTVTDQGGNVATKRITLQVNAAAGAEFVRHRVADTQSTRACDLVRRGVSAPRRRCGAPNQRDLCGALHEPARSGHHGWPGCRCARRDQPGGTDRRRGRSRCNWPTQQHGNLEQRINALRSGATGIDLAGLDLNIDGESH